MLVMAEIQFVAGTKSVFPLHEQARLCSTLEDARRLIQSLPIEPYLTKILSAHVMGSCGLSADERKGVSRPDGLHWQLENLSVHDGSLFPTGIGANPQLSIYGIVNRITQGLIQRLTGHEVALA